MSKILMLTENLSVAESDLKSSEWILSFKKNPATSEHIIPYVRVVQEIKSKILYYESLITDKNRDKWLNSI